MIANQFTPTDAWLIVVVLVLLVVLAFLAVAEMGLSRMTKPKAASLADGGGRSAVALLKLVSEPERWINPLLLTVNICQIVQATLTGYVAGRVFGAAGLVVGVILNVIVFFVLAEAVPKTYAVQHSERAALLTARPILLLVSFPPLRWISRGLIGLTNVIAPGKGLERGPFVNEQELLGIVETAAEEGVVEEDERDLIESIIEFGDTVAREVMVPRPDIVTLQPELTVTGALDVAMEKGFSRLPVLTDDDNEDVIGVAYAKDLMRAERTGGGGRPVTDFVRAARFVPENKPVNRLMREMQAETFHLALVVDEYGAIAGLITLEDCLEELVGEIVDEHDDEDAEVHQLEGGEYSVDGGMAISDLNDLLGTNIPDDDWDTVAGFVFNTLEHVPDVGESIDHDGWRITATEIDGRRIRRVMVSAIDPFVEDADRSSRSA